MSIHVFDYSVDFACDSCGEEDNFEGDLQEAAVAARDDGWKMTNKFGEWTHLCPVCAD